MNFHVLTLFPEMVMQGLHTSILGRAVSKGYMTIEAVNIRDYTNDKHGKVDDYTYGGGAGMLMQAQPVYDAYRAVADAIANRKAVEAEPAAAESAEGIQERNGGSGCAQDRQPRVVYLTPQGRTFHQKMAEEFAKEEDLIFLCGHYEGIDERVIEEIVTDPVSIGDYVLTGGELPAMVMIDAIARLVPGGLHNDESAVSESFYHDLLEYPQYSRPEIWHEKKVPEILLSGNHAKVDEWRLAQSIERTKKLRPDLYEKWKQRSESECRQDKKRS